MKKSIVASVILLTLAGCSASAVFAESPSKGVSAAATKPVTKTASPSISYAKTLILKEKLQRNKVKMTKVVKYLKTRVNRTSYVFSGSSPYGWDCSGMVRWAYTHFGMELPHSANKQGHVGERVSKPKIGDIVVFAYQGSTSFYHSAIYIGNGKIVHAHQQRKTTVIEPLSNYKNSQIRIVRVVPQPEAKSTPVL
jgi:cell wall-associated NlpC family hydrolase